MPNLNIPYSVEEFEALKTKKRKLEYEKNKDFGWKDLLVAGLDAELQS